MADRGDDTNSNRGFASMDKETRERIARKGGEHSHGGHGGSSPGGERGGSSGSSSGGSRGGSSGGRSGRD